MYYLTLPNRFSGRLIKDGQLQHQHGRFDWKSRTLSYCHSHFKVLGFQKPCSMPLGLSILERIGWKALVLFATWTHQNETKRILGLQRLEWGARRSWYDYDQFNHFRSVSQMESSYGSFQFFKMECFHTFLQSIVCHSTEVCHQILFIEIFN